MKKQICLMGTFPDKYREALSLLDDDLNIDLSADGVRVNVERGENLTVNRSGNDVNITWAQRVHFYRALSLLSQHWDDSHIDMKETPCFATLGMMFDVSRNAVLKPATLQFFLRKMALMGMNLGMMYTEDTYEVPNMPFFGYMRGRYSQKELRDLDDYADILGIELCPCIQTLGHLNRVLHWPPMQRLADNSEVLLADSEDTYRFLEQIILAAAAPYRSKRIHIGMDEAHGIGLGEHLRKFGYENPHTIIRRHLTRVKQITDKLGLLPMMWSDMYFRPDSSTNGYYDSGEPSKAALESAFPDITLVYWDYYHNEEQDYEKMLYKHKQFSAPTAFAGGIWTFAGPCPDYDKTLRTTVHALTACKKANIPLVFATAWGDNGAEANLLTALPGMQLFSEFSYTSQYDKEELSERFKACCNADIEAFFDLSLFNALPGIHSGWLRPANAAKMILYQDPLIQLYLKDFEGVEASSHYKMLAKRYDCYAEENSEFSKLFLFYKILAEVLFGKSHWHEKISTCVKNKDMDTAKQLAEEMTQTVAKVEELRWAWLDLWNSTYKPYGFEVLDLRIGGLRARLLTAQKRLFDFIEQNGETMPELLEEVLPYTKKADGTLFGSYAVSEIVSACKIDL